MAKQYILTQDDVRAFEKYLNMKEYSHHTIYSYSSTIRKFIDEFDGVLNQMNIIAYKEKLLDINKPQSVNLRLKGLSCFLRYKNIKDFNVKYIKCQRFPFLEHVLSNADYNYLKMRLRRDKEMKWYYLFWFLGATGCRVSEVIRVKVEDVELGYVDMICKGQKLRRIYIPIHLQKELMKYIKQEHIPRGSFLWHNKNGERLEIVGIEHMCKVFAKKYGLNPTDVYPHAFRHRFAMNFLEASGNDLILLADLLGHSNLETTRRYLQKTAWQQRQALNQIVTW